VRFLGLGHTLRMVVECALLSVKHEHEKRKGRSKRSVGAGFVMVVVVIRFLCVGMSGFMVVIGGVKDCSIRGICVLKMDGSGLRVSRLIRLTFGALFVCCLFGC